MPSNYGMQKQQVLASFKQNYPQSYEDKRKINSNLESPKLSNPPSTNESFDGNQLSSVDTERSLQERYDDVRSQILNPCQSMPFNSSQIKPQNPPQSMNFNYNAQPEMTQSDMFNQWSSINMFQNQNYPPQMANVPQFPPNVAQMKPNYAELYKDQEENPYSKFLIQQQMNDEEKDSEEDVLNQSMKMIINQAQAQINSQQMTNPQVNYPLMSNPQMMNNQMMKGQNTMQQNVMSGKNFQQFNPQNMKYSQFENLQQLPKLNSQMTDSNGNSSDPPTNRVLEFNMADRDENNDVENFDDKPIKPAANFDFYSENDAEKENTTIQDYDEIPVGGSKNLVSKNIYDERPVGGSTRNVVEDVPIKSKAKNFEELLEKELKKNPDATMAADEMPKNKPRKKEFLKRKKPVTAPPKNTKPSKYKYYAENFTDNPLGPIDSSQKPAVKQQTQTPFGNTAERKAAQSQPEPMKKKPKEKKTFLVRGGGIGGGIGPKQTQKEEKSLKSDRSQTRKKSF